MDEKKKAKKAKEKGEKIDDLTEPKKAYQKVDLNNYFNRTPELN